MYIIYLFSFVVFGGIISFSRCALCPACIAAELSNCNCVSSQHMTLSGSISVTILGCERRYKLPKYHTKTDVLFKHSLAKTL